MSWLYRPFDLLRGCVLVQIMQRITILLIWHPVFPLKFECVQPGGDVILYQFFRSKVFRNHMRTHRSRFTKRTEKRHIFTVGSDAFGSWWQRNRESGISTDYAQPKGNTGLHNMPLRLSHFHSTPYDRDFFLVSVCGMSSDKLWRISVLLLPTHEARSKRVPVGHRLP